MNFVYYTKSKQEQMAVFAWLIKRGYLEKNSNVAYKSPIDYDFICVDVDCKEFGFFTGQFNNTAGVAVTTSHNVSVLLKEIESAELMINTTYNFTVSTNSLP